MTNVEKGGLVLACLLLFTPIANLVSKLLSPLSGEIESGLVATYVAFGGYVCVLAPLAVYYARREAGWSTLWRFALSGFALMPVVWVIAIAMWSVIDRGSTITDSSHGGILIELFLGSAGALLLATVWLAHRTRCALTVQSTRTRT
jgi:hypothetical protein